MPIFSAAPASASFVDTAMSTGRPFRLWLLTASVGAVSYMPQASLPRVLPVQGAENRVYPLRPKEAFMALVNQCAYYPWAADSAARMTELAAALIGAVPVYGLTCRKDEGAVRALEDYLRRA